MSSKAQMLLDYAAGRWSEKNKLGKKFLDYPSHSLDMNLIGMLWHNLRLFMLQKLSNVAE